MTLNSELLRDALDFAFSKNRIRKLIKKRNLNPYLIIGAINTQIKSAPKKDKAAIRIAIDYHHTNLKAPKLEDLVIKVLWDKTKGFKISSVNTVREV